MGFNVLGENHSKPTYKKSEQAGGEDFSGWWFGPKVGGDQVWAYHANKASTVPPSTGWRVPFNGDVDPSLSIKPIAAGGPPVGVGLKPGQPALTPQQKLQEKMKEDQEKRKAAVAEANKKREEEMAAKKEAQEQMMAQMKSANEIRKILMQVRQATV